MVQVFNAVLSDMEVRKVEETEVEINDKVYRSLLVHFDDVDCTRLVFKDRNIENKEKYVRGQIGTLTLEVSTENKIQTGKSGNQYIAEKTVITIHDWKVKKK